ncbi:MULTISPECIES: hypothetical protein [Bradyrhizobium]|uniref:ORC-CDC6 family AAA ATPase n=1 Tax=Bradyrhizobium TaxID=374 RepID=UPI0004B34E84|nr:MULTISPECIES: hypothetical protein [Bradyrhizobium]MCA1477986.1 hypothetical protein [Bradyrhizobium sp. NBAIM08]
MRNPFRLRASKRSVHDEQFVRLFAAGALDLLNDADEPWSGVVFLRSAPGGGKTTLLRLLTPGPLRKIFRMQDDQDVRPTRDALVKAGALSADGPTILGVMIGFTNEYRDLDEVGNGGPRSTAVFRALVNARIVLATLRAALERSEKTYPDDLIQIRASWQPVDGATLPAVATGVDLHKWASQIEESVFEILDDLGGEDKPMPKAASGLEALQWLATAQLTDAAGPILQKRVLLLDDLQFLGDEQSQWLRETVANARLPCGIWIAERLEALPAEDLLAEGALEDRDYDGEIRLERRWRKRSVAYVKFVDQIADLRARDADGFQGRAFFPALAEELDAADWDSVFEAQCGAIERRLLARIGQQQRYSQWLAQRRTVTGSSRDRALSWRELEILIERDIAKSQRAFDFDALTEEDLSDKENTAVRAAAEIFLSKEAKAPIYFGRQKLAMLSSSNVDQFVELAGDLFEELAAKTAVRRGADSILNAERQHLILKRAAERRWEGIPRRVPKGYEARRFLEAVGAFCAGQTYRPSAPYPPGVTGFGITMQDRARLIDGGRESATFSELRSMLAALVSQNLLEPTLDHKNKGESLIIFNLNRVLCAHFDLPLGYGGWRKKSLKELTEWLARGRAAVTEKSLV